VQRPAGCPEIQGLAGRFAALFHHGMPAHLTRRGTQQITAAVIRRGADVLLVRQQGPDDPEPFWGLPGGRVEEGELLPEALAREVREETGLEILDIGQLLYLAQLHNLGDVAQSQEGLPGPFRQFAVFVFEIRRWAGEISPADPDEYILEAQFVPPAEAIRRLDGVRWRIAREPITTYLRGGARPGTVWSYRRKPDGEDELIARLDGTGASEAMPGRLPPALRRETAPQEQENKSQRQATPRTLNQQLALASCLIVVLAVIALVVVGIIAVLPHFL
jgi:8-oxo-dGTP diphosphatase